MRHGRPGCRVRGGCAESERGRRVAQPAGTRTGTTGWTGDPTAPAPVASAPSAQQRHDTPTAAGMEAREGRAPPRAASELAAELKQDAEPRRPARAPPPAPRKTLKAVLRDATPAQGGSARPPGPPRSPCARGRGRRTSRCTCCGSSSDDGTSALTVEPRSPHEHARSSSWALGGEGQTSCCTRAPGSAQGAAQDWHRPDMLRRWTESHPAVQGARPGPVTTCLSAAPGQTRTQGHPLLPLWGHWKRPNSSPGTGVRRGLAVGRDFWERRVAVGPFCISAVVVTQLHASGPTQDRATRREALTDGDDAPNLTSTTPATAGPGPSPPADGPASSPDSSDGTQALSWASEPCLGRPCPPRLPAPSTLPH